MFLQNYDYKIEHWLEESHVDALSRCNSILVLEKNIFERYWFHRIKIKRFGIYEIN